MSGHTRGEWRTRNSVYVEECCSGRTIADCGMEYDGDSPLQHASKLQHGLENAANARLIASAPALLAACRHGLVNSEAYKARLVKEGCLGLANCVEDDLIAIRSAIASAEGKGG